MSSYEKKLTSMNCDHEFLPSENRDKCSYYSIFLKLIYVILDSMIKITGNNQETKVSICY